MEEADLQVEQDDEDNQLENRALRRVYFLIA